MALHKMARDMADFLDVPDQLVVGVEAVADEERRLDPRDGEVVARGLQFLLRDLRGIGFDFRALARGFVRGRVQVAGRVLEMRPDARGGQADLLVVAREAIVIGGEGVGALGLGQVAHQLVVLAGEHRGGGAVRRIECVELLAAHAEHAAPGHGQRAVGVRLGVGEQQGRAPRAAGHVPLLEAQMLAQPVEVGDQKVRVVVVDAGIGLGFAGTALVVGDDVERLGVEEAVAVGRRARARPAVQVDDRDAVEVAVLFIRDGVFAVGGLDLAHATRLAFRIKPVLPHDLFPLYNFMFIQLIYDYLRLYVNEGLSARESP